MVFYTAAPSVSCFSGRPDVKRLGVSYNTLLVYIVWSVYILVWQKTSSVFDRIKENNDSSADLARARGRREQ